MARRGEVETLVTLIRWQPWPVATRLGVLFSQPCIAGKRSIPICMCIHTYMCISFESQPGITQIYILEKEGTKARIEIKGREEIP